MSSVLPGLQYTASHPILVGRRITEYDMASAGMTVIRQDNLLPPRMIEYLSHIPKEDASIAVGKLSRTPEYKGLSKQITDGIRNRMEQFLIVNGIKRELIHAVKRDAFFLLDVQPSVLTLDNGTVFRVKSAFNSYVRLDRTEFYAAIRSRNVAVKGIPDEKLGLHTGMIEIILDFLTAVSAGNVQEAANIVSSVRSEYIEDKLDAEYYREFNAGSQFVYKVGSRFFGFDSEEPELRENLQIEFNLQKVFRYLIQSIA